MDTCTSDKIHIKLDESYFSLKTGDIDLTISDIEVHTQNRRKSNSLVCVLDIQFTCGIKVKSVRLVKKSNGEYKLCTPGFAHKDYVQSFVYFSPEVYNWLKRVAVEIRKLLPITGDSSKAKFETHTVTIQNPNRMAKPTKIVTMAKEAPNLR